MKILLRGSTDEKFRVIEVSAINLEINDSVIYLSFYSNSIEYIYKSTTNYSKPIVKCKNLMKSNLIDLTSNWKLMSIGTESTINKVHAAYEDWEGLCDKFNTFYMSLEYPNVFEKEMHLTPTIFNALRCRDMNVLSQYNYDYVNSCINKTIRDVTSILMRECGNY